jgi:hypothetical protein
VASCVQHTPNTQPLHLTNQPVFPSLCLCAAACLAAGGSREKVRLTDELKRAELDVARCKEVIRQAARYCQEVPAGELSWLHGTRRGGKEMDVRNCT